MIDQYSYKHEIDERFSNGVAEGLNHAEPKVSREDELAKLNRVLTPSGVYFAVHGESQSGKSVLVHQFAYQQCEKYRAAGQPAAIIRVNVSEMAKGEFDSIFARSLGVRATPPLMNIVEVLTYLNTPSGSHVLVPNIW